MKLFFIYNREMKFIVLLLLLVVVVSSCPSYFPPIWHANQCEFTKEQALQCVAEYMDFNKDGVVSLGEVHQASSVYLPGYIRALSWIASVDDTTLIHDCGDPSDTTGAKGLTPETFRANPRCLPTQSALCKMKWVCGCAYDVTNAERNKWTSVK